MTRLLYSLLGLVLSAALGGCVSLVPLHIPQPEYKKVDQTSLVYQKAVKQEAEERIAKGQAPAKAKKDSTRAVTRRIVNAAVAVRLAEVAPLVETLRSFEKPAGCWSYTATTMLQVDGKTTLKVERYDPFQPESRLWTLVSENGEEPAAETQSDYRRKKLRAWKKNLSSRRTARSGSDTNFATGADMEIVSKQSSQEWIFTTGHISMPAVGTMGAEQKTYVVRDGTLVSERRRSLGPTSMLGGAIKIAYRDVTTDYVLITPDLPPFVAKRTWRIRMSSLGVDSGEQIGETVYSDYVQVKCYDARFSVKLGELNIMEFIPE